MSFLQTTEDLWENGPVRKLYYTRKFNLAFDALIENGVTPEEARGLAHLEVLKRLCELFKCTQDELYNIKGVEMLRLIQPSGKEMFNGYKLEINPPDKYIRGYIDGRNIELMEAANLTYDEYEFIVLEKNIDHESKTINLRAL